jgi:hypothetical protein
MLLPALGKAREKARTIKCAGNLRQQAGAVMFYTSDYDDYFPAYRESVATPSVQNGYHLFVIAEYLGIIDMNAGPLACPSDSPPAKYIYFDGAWGTTLKTSYGGSDFVFNGPGFNVKLSQVTRPTETMTLADSTITHSMNGARSSRFGTDAGSTRPGPMAMWNIITRGIFPMGLNAA